MGRGARAYRWEHEYSRYGPLDWSAMLLPCISWLRSYKWSSYLQVLAAAAPPPLVPPLSSSLSAFPLHAHSAHPPVADAAS